MIILGDCIDKIKEIPDESVHCIITTPPWGDIWSYHNHPDMLIDKEGCSGKYDFPTLAKEMYRVLKSGGVLCWHIGDDKERLVPARQVLYFVDGFTLHATIVVDRTKGIPYAIFKDKYSLSYEYVYCLSKGMVKTFHKIKDIKIWSGPARIQEDIIELLEPLIGIAGLNGSEWMGADKDNDCSITRIALNKDALPDKYKEDMSELTALCNTVCVHPAMTPKWLVKDLILTYTDEGDIILDPFSGMGTTVLEAEKLGRVGIGIEINPKYT